MVMSILWTGMTAASILFGIAEGRGEAVAAAAVTGAKDAVELCLSMAGMLCLWTGVMEVMRQSGLAGGLSRLLRPVLGRLFPGAARDGAVMDSLSANVSANLLGLGNAATPLGIEAAKGMSRSSPGAASDELCLLVVCNTASIQLLPTTVAAVRAAAGCESPFDILPAVWLASALSGGAGMTQMLVPCVLAGTALYGTLRRVDVYGALVRGAGQGLETLARILPALVCLLTAVSMVRASGLLEALASWLSPVLGRLGLPSELLPLMLVRPISGSAALGVGADLINAYGPDSALGRTAAVMLGSTETTFYTIAVYFSAAGITRTRYAVPAALCADLVGFLASAWAVGVVFG